MRRVVLARPDVSVPVPVWIMIIAGAISGTVACAWFLAGRISMCGILPVMALSAVAMAPFPWAFRRRARRGRWATFVLVGAAIFWAAVAIACRSGWVDVG